MCPSLDVRDELTAQLLFQLHGLFENNVMSFITDNSRKWLLWQPGKRMGLTSQSEVPVVPPVCIKSLFSMGAPPHPLLGEEPWEEKGKRRAGGRTTQPKGRGQMRKPGPKDKRDSRNWLFLPNSSMARTMADPLYPPGTLHTPDTEQTLKNRASSRFQRRLRKAFQDTSSAL